MEREGKKKGGKKAGKNPPRSKIIRGGGEIKKISKLNLIKKPYYTSHLSSCLARTKIGSFIYI